MSDDLVKRLRAATDGATVNPDGPEAADRIAELEAALGDLLRCTEKHVFGDECKAQRDKARAALEGGKKDG